MLRDTLTRCLKICGFKLHASRPRNVGKREAIQRHPKDYGRRERRNNLGSGAHGIFHSTTIRAKKKSGGGRLWVLSLFVSLSTLFMNSPDVAIVGDCTPISPSLTAFPSLSALFTVPIIPRARPSWPLPSSAAREAHG